MNRYFEDEKQFAFTNWEIMHLLAAVQFTETELDSRENPGDYTPKYFDLTIILVDKLLTALQAFEKLTVDEMIDEDVYDESR